MNSEIRYLAQQLLHAGLGPLCERDRRVIARVARRVHTARDVNKVFEQNLTFGDRLAGSPFWAARGRPVACAFLMAWAIATVLLSETHSILRSFSSIFCCRCWRRCGLRSS
jgi:hypothetical protein